MTARNVVLESGPATVQWGHVGFADQMPTDAQLLESDHGFGNRRAVSQATTVGIYVADVEAVVAGEL